MVTIKRSLFLGLAIFWGIIANSQRVMEKLDRVDAGPAIPAEHCLAAYVLQPATAYRFLFRGGNEDSDKAYLVCTALI